MDDIARKKLWRRKKAEVKELFRKHNIKKFEDRLIQEQMKNEDLLNSLWSLGFSVIHFHICIWIPEIHNAPLRHIFINRCDGGPFCEACKSPEAYDIAQVFSDELYDRLPDSQINACKWLWLDIDRQNWTPDDFNFIVEPQTCAHSRYAEINTGISPRIVWKESNELPKGNTL